MNYTKLAKVQSQKITDSAKKQEFLDALKKRRARQAVLDALKKRRARQNRVADSKKFNVFKVSDSYKRLKKKIKDEFEETESTEAAIEVALANITPDAPAQQVVAAVTEVLAETIDALEEQVADGPEEEEFEEETYEEIKDSLKHEEVVVALLKNRKSGKFNWDSDGTLTHKGEKLGKVTYKDFTKKCEKLDELVDNALKGE